jgi:hypothetical protein
MLGTQVQVVLVELAQQLEAIGPQALLEFGVGEVGRLGATEETDEILISPVGSREGPAQALRPSWATNVSSPELASASSFRRALRYRAVAFCTGATSSPGSVTERARLCSE